jgi:CBS domain-containing protein
MTQVRDILKVKGSEVVTIGREETVLAAAAKMNQQRIGALVVMQDDKLVGIFTERDIMNRVVAAQQDAATTRVHEVMTVKVACCTMETSLEECRRAMTNHKIRHLPVMEDEKLAGLLSIGDLLARELAAQQETIRFLHEYMQGPN